MGNWKADLVEGPLKVGATNYGDTIAVRLVEQFIQSCGINVNVAIHLSITDEALVDECNRDPYMNTVYNPKWESITVVFHGRHFDSTGVWPKTLVQTTRAPAEDIGTSVQNTMAQAEDLEASEAIRRRYTREEALRTESTDSLTQKKSVLDDDAKSLEEFIRDEQAELTGSENEQQLEEVFRMSDLVIVNDSTLEELYDKVEDLL